MAQAAGDNRQEQLRAQGGLGAFLGEALTGLKRRDIVVPGLLLLVLLTVSNVVVLQNMPRAGSPPPLPFLIAAFIRVGGLLLLVVGILRLVTGSARRPWLPDGGFWLYLLTFAVSAAINAGVGLIVGSRDDIANLILANVMVTLLLSPLVVWFVALAVAKPLALSPRPWVARFGRWWPPLLFWTLLLVMPMAVAHAAIDLRLVQGVGNAFWPLALFDGLLSTAMALLALALNAAAYRRVAED